MSSRSVLSAAAALLIAACACRAETGYSAWLRYEPITEPAEKSLYDRLPPAVVAMDASPLLESAQSEIIRGAKGMLDRTLRAENAPVDDGMIVLGTFEEVARPFSIPLPAHAADDTYVLKTLERRGHRCIFVTGPNGRGVLYGAFAFLRHIVLHQRIDHLDEQSTPYQVVRWVNQWDNLNGTIERGYGGKSIFFANDQVLQDLSRAADYARLLASLGINGCTVNNVNANPKVLTSGFIPQLARIADVFRPWGVQLSISVDLGSPKTIGGLSTFDPLDPHVAEWWKQKADEIYRAIPDFGGFLLKADSEGRVGPSTYGRTHADAANVLAAALAPHHGIVVYRGFVYNHHLDWKNLKNDRARAAYDNFHSLDGKFAPNAAVQIKYGPIDFQVREPVSPLIAGLEKTNEVLELQITQEYTGQQRQLCYLVPMWKQILDFDLRANGRETEVKDIVSGKTFDRPLGGMAGVANVGNDPNWLGFDLAMANLYGFGRLAWNPDLSTREITSEWTRLTFGSDRLVDDTIEALELESWPVYEGYTGVLGLQTLTDIVGSHYQPNVSAAEHNGWGQWIRADHDGVGMDRSVATGTGYAGQYPPEVAKQFESVDTTPDNLVLFFHHLPYTHVLHSGVSVIQYIYNAHYDAAAEAQQFPRWWRTLRGRIDDERYAAVLAKLDYQAGYSIVWRDSICNWFFRESGIPDALGRVDHYPDRTEAEKMKLDGYTPYDVKPPEDASGGKAVVCNNRPSCSAEFTFSGKPGWYDVDVQYFDENSGDAQFQVFVNTQRIAQWAADMWLPSAVPSGDTSVRKRIANVELRPGDRIKIVGKPNGRDQAALDYVAVHPAEAANAASF